MRTQNQILRTLRIAPAWRSIRSRLPRRWGAVASVRDSILEMRADGGRRPGVGRPSRRWRPKAGGPGRCSGRPVTAPAAQEGSRSARPLRGLEVVRMADPEQRAVWNTLLPAEPPGAGPGWRGGQYGTGSAAITGYSGRPRRSICGRGTGGWVGRGPASAASVPGRRPEPVLVSAGPTGPVTGWAKAPADLVRRYGSRP